MANGKTTLSKPGSQADLIRSGTLLGGREHDSIKAREDILKKMPNILKQFTQYYYSRKLSFTATAGPYTWDDAENSARAQSASADLGFPSSQRSRFIEKLSRTSPSSRSRVIPRVLPYGISFRQKLPRRVSEKSNNP